MDKELVNILLVDDREDGLLAMEVVLDSGKYNLVKAKSGVEAIDKLRKNDFAMILMDVQMPGLDGFETAAIIKKNDLLKDIPIVFVTAINKDDMYVHRGYLTGAVDYIFKPFDPQVLQSKVAVFSDLYLKNKHIKEQAVALKESETRERYLKLAELELQNLKRYRNLADAIPHIVWRAHGDGTLDYFNTHWSEYTGLSQAESRGNGWQSVFEDNELNSFLKKWVHAISSGKGFEMECRIRSKDGESRWHWLKLSADLDFYGHVVSWIATAIDIQDRKMMEERLRISKNEADAANRAKSHFLANMSHEIRTPLGAILGFAELLGKPNLSDDERKNVVATIQRNGSALLKIIDEILDLSKVEAGKVELEKVTVPLDSLLNDVHEMFAVKAKRKNLDLNISLVSSLPSKIETDPTRLRQLFVNLVGNALKFTQNGHVNVTVSWRQDDKEQDRRVGILRVDVTDTGIGIDQEKVNTLFKPFTQVDSSTSRKFGGTGLGLALSRQLAQAMGGNVWIEKSDVAGGSTFAFEVRSVMASDAQMILQLPENKEHNEAEESYPNNYLAGMNILLAEDSEDNQVLIRYFLEQVGARVEITDDGKKAYDLAMGGDYDLVMMDIQMPVMDGYQAISLLRENKYKGAVIAITAHALKEDREHCLAIGFDNHVTKPIQGNVLVREVARYRKNPGSNSALAMKGLLKDFLKSNVNVPRSDR